MAGQDELNHAPNADGRRARRDRGRLAVTNAMIDLVFEGNVPPSVEQVAERSGVSVASIFRYFETLDDLRQTTTTVYFERYAHLFDLPNVGEGRLNDRIDTFVASRSTLYETTEPMARLVRIRASENPDADDLVHRVRATRIDQIRHHFGAELDRLTPAVRDDTVAVIGTLTSFESWDQVRHDHDRSPTQLRRGWATALRKLLA